MDAPVDGRSGSVDNPLIFGLQYQGSIEIRSGVFVVPERTRVHVRGVRQRRGILICRVVAAAAAGFVEFELCGVVQRAHFPTRLLVRDPEGVEFVAFGDEVTPIGGRPSREGVARLRVLIGDPLR